MTEYQRYILTKAQKYCTYQDRCLSDVKTKLAEWQAQPKVADEIIAQLIRDDYLNEERFARNFAVGKFRQKRWGKNKIIHALKLKQLPDLIIQIGLEAIDDEEYTRTLVEILKKKSAEIKDKNQYRRNYKLAAYAIRKGFRSGLVWDVIYQLV